jgi:hypothetical protein
MAKASAGLIAACRHALWQHEIEPFGHRKLVWVMSPALVEESWEPGISNEMFGYPVVTDPLLDSDTVMLTERIAVVPVRQTTPST